MQETLDKYGYYFGDGSADGEGTMKPLLGGKGANLAEMTRLGLPVPPGFTITTEVCTYFYDNTKFCHRLGLDYVSCSPFRVPIARLAAAQAALQK
jgi:phosphoenolpyruvate synthase/pyruvate phosphate dikinase